MIDNKGPIQLTAGAVVVLVIAIILVVQFGVKSIAYTLITVGALFLVVVFIAWLYNLSNR